MIDLELSQKVRSKIKMRFISEKIYKNKDFLFKTYLAKSIIIFHCNSKTNNSENSNTSFLNIYNIFF